MAISFQKIPEFTRGIRFRLSVVYSALFGICLILLSIFITGEYLQLARDDYDQYLRNFALDMANFIEVSPDQQTATLKVPMTEQIKFFPFVIQNTMVTVRSLDSKVLYNNRSDSQIPYAPELARRRNYTHRFVDFYLGEERMRALNLKINKGSTSLILQVANSVETLRSQQERHFLFLLAIIPFTLILSALFSTIVAGRALEPIRQLARQMDELLRGGNYTPLPVPQTFDEIEQLTRNFNGLITQMQRTLEAQERFVANASHQLNTPLAIMRGELEVLQSRERSPEEVQRFHQSLHQELQRLTQLVQDMLLVSRVKAGKAHFTFVPLPMDEVLGETLERMAKIAKRKRISIRYNIADALISDVTKLTYSGERQLLICLFENLLENCIKYSPDDSRISVQLILDEGQLVVEICDEGPGMSPEVMNSLNDPQRFKRGGETSGIPGSGLGLYLAYKVADFHHATIEAKPNIPKGTRFRVTFRAPSSV